MHVRMHQINRGLCFGVVMLLVGLLSSQSLTPRVAAQVDGVINPENGHRYELINEALSWDGARLDAEQHVYGGVRGHLVTITSASEQAFVVSMLPEFSTPWIGGYQPVGSEEPDQGWRWVNDEAWEYTAWRSGEPNNNLNESVLQIQPGGWNDFQAVVALPYVVEYDLGTSGRLPDARWDDRFAPNQQGTNGTVNAVAADADGNILVGGAFYQVGHIQESNFARWEGDTWSSLDTDVNGQVHAVLVTDDSIYIGGMFTLIGSVAANNIARWDGETCTALDSGTNATVRALVMDASGNLFAGGDFSTAGGIEVNHVARWDGEAWSALGKGVVGGRVMALAMDERNNTLYIGGYNIQRAGDVEVRGVARWDGRAWSALGRGIATTVNALALDAAGVLYAGGVFSYVENKPAENLASWNGSTWSEFAGGTRGAVFAIEIADDGAIYIGGELTRAGQVPVASIARWNDGWTALGDGTNGSVRSIDVTSDGVVVGGTFTEAGGTTANNVARWSGDVWSPLQDIYQYDLDGPVRALTLDSEERLYAGGDFARAGKVEANSVARLGDDGWEALGTGVNGRVYALATSGTVLYAGGTFTETGGVAANNVARWNGTAWEALGAGFNGGVFALAVAPDGDMYAGGNFTQAGDVTVNRIARWDGSAWQPLGDGMNAPVYALVMNGDTLYAGGAFRTAGDTAARYVAQWSDGTWNELGIGVNRDVRALAFHDDKLYAGGDFTQAGTTEALFIATWDGAAWSPLSLDATAGPQLAVSALAFDRFGYLYAGGEYEVAGGRIVRHIARWAGSDWEALSTGLDGDALALVAGSDALYVGGSFSTAGLKQSSNIARWDTGIQTTIFIPLIFK